MNFNSPQSRYILPSFEERTAYGMKQQDPYSKLFSERIIFLGTQIDEVSADDIMSQLLVLAHLDSDRDITLYINSPGGSDLTALTAIYDTMNYISPNVSTVCLGKAFGSAALLLGAGNKGQRGALPNSRIMLGQPEGPGMPGQASDIVIAAEEMERNYEWFQRTLGNISNRTNEQVNEDTDRSKYLNAEEAVAYGLIDVVLTNMKG